MAEEGTLGQARASGERDEEEPSKEELQRRMEEARESITQTVTEIKETVTNQYYTVKETVSDALDWRYHFRQRPIAFSVGALSVGFLLGYSVAGALKGNGSGEDYPSYEESDVYARTGASPSKDAEYDEEVRHTAFHGHSYAAQPITDNLSGESSDYAGSSSPEAALSAGNYRPQHGASYSYSAVQEEEDEGEQKPGLLERFKGTTAYDRLQSEVSSLGDRFIDELSTTAHKVVLPALFNKIRELFGVDLSGQQGQQQAQSSSSSGETKQTGTDAQSTNAQAQSASAASASRGASGSSYGTSENQGYGSQSSERAGSQGSNDSVLDLDR